MKDITLQTIVVLSINNRFIVNQNTLLFTSYRAATELLT